MFNACMRLDLRVLIDFVCVLLAAPRFQAAAVELDAADQQLLSDIKVNRAASHTVAAASCCYRLSLI